MFTYITTTTVPSFLELQKLYNVTYSEITWTVAVPSLGLCIGPLIWSSLSDIYGRRLIFIVGTTIALAATIGTAVSKSYGVYMIARAFQGLGVSPGGTVGMAIINECVYTQLQMSLIANDPRLASFSSTRGAKRSVYGCYPSTQVSWSDQSASQNHLQRDLTY